MHVQEECLLLMPPRYRPLFLESLLLFLFYSFPTQPFYAFFLLLTSLQPVFQPIPHNIQRDFSTSGTLISFCRFVLLVALGSIFYNIVNQRGKGWKFSFVTWTKFHFYHRDWQLSKLSKSIFSIYAFLGLFSNIWNQFHQHFFFVFFFIKETCLQYLKSLKSWLQMFLVHIKKKNYSFIKKIIGLFRILL